MDWLKILKRRLRYGGTGLRRYEAQLLDHAAASLSPDDGTALRAQVAARQVVQRSHGGRMVAFFFPEHRETLPRLSTSSEEACLLQIQLQSPTGRNRVALVAHKGLLSSLEFSTSPLPLKSETFEIVRTVAGGRRVSLAAAANRLEHGSDDAAS